MEYASDFILSIVTVYLGLWFSVLITIFSAFILFFIMDLLTWVSSGNEFGLTISFLSKIKSLFKE